MNELLQALRQAKPAAIHLDAEAVDRLRNPDCLSLSDVSVFRNGGTVNGQPAVPFVELTPELLAVLRAVYEQEPAK